MTRFVETTITFPYRRSLGPVLGAFMTALTERRILGSRAGDDVFVPPTEWDPATGAPLTHDLVEVGPAGTVESWTWVPSPTTQHPLDRPFAFAFIRLDGATTPLLHAVDAGSAERLEVGRRVAPRWRAARIGHISDICCFVVGEQPEVETAETVEADLAPQPVEMPAPQPVEMPAPQPVEMPAPQPVEMMDYHASITYRNPVPPAADRAIAASRDQRLLGLRCPICDRVYVGGRGYCPIDSLELGPDCELDLPHTGTITNFVVVTPVQYPGQTETEPFARVFVLLDGFDVVLGYQPVIELPVDQLRVGRRVAAVWASPAEIGDTDTGGMGQSLGSLIGWMPSGEPDVDDPDLVNRIF